MMKSRLVEPIKYFLSTRAIAFRYAFAGWWHVIRTQRNAWVHTVFSVFAIGIGFWLHITPLEMALIILAITLVWTAEFLNTALEAVVDLASPQQHPLARVGKDVGAAAVLIASLASILIGVLVFGPPLLVKLGF